ncbi:MAG: molybdopterin adenylyltransferase [Polynucleobacter sp. 24-46-87]|jgi:molybdopterin adenylyltransferase|nr:MAG: molybdopterin adenylyltransferase [Polynucleobacter sp. 35-46-207]OYZ35593.1 MAG: molybdopterin adenylyltransferase [Polynucleobacter sp. 16-46-70]OZA00195.1 MAG: molybdopterin adenylyltransferase [Polynucleobacter sp. 24-46-87]OZA29711.1 MAG: molybdopterin adenylyltransferase [Polynucleobacter sp. 17-46-58]OZB36250.1 MAG: molybdopterin adenylyltransferase [Polynucleobacter sp. 39-45-136]HQR84769.1 molybdopterin adenylyltransferase [Polynucleobacter sp.]
MKHTEAWARSAPNEIKIGLISISDRASQGVYADQGIPALQTWLKTALSTPHVFHERLIADEREVITETIVELCDELGCDLILTTGGTGPARRDVTPEATIDAGTREMPGFGEQMRQISLRFVPTAILSRQTAVLREIEGHTALVINLPGQPKSIKETLEGLKDAEGNSIVPGIFAAVPYCIELFGGPIVQTHESVIKVFRPKSAVKT